MKERFCSFKRKSHYYKVAATHAATHTPQTGGQHVAVTSLALMPTQSPNWWRKTPDAFCDLLRKGVEGSYLHSRLHSIRAMESTQSLARNPKRKATERKQKLASTNVTTVQLQEYGLNILNNCETKFYKNISNMNHR